MQNIYETFEFNKVREAIAELCKSEIGKAKILSLEKLDDKESVLLALNENKEMLSLLTRFPLLPLSNSVNILSLIDLAKKSGLFSIRDISLIKEDISSSLKLIAYFNKVEGEYPLLRNKISHFVDLSQMEKEIKKAITPNLTIDDKATPTLKAIRDKLRNLEENLNSKVISIASKYSANMSDSNVTIRDGHFVLPIKTSDKNKVLGIIYDVSSSGNTTFIEPLEIVQLNNDIATLKVEENAEIRKILKQLTNMVLLQEDEVRNNNLIIGELDFLASKTLFALKNDMHLLELSDKQEIHLYNARHPNIDPKVVVSNDFHFDENKRIVVISGPNAGGKTVSLKTVGIIALMFLSGLYVPVSEGKMGYFNNIYVDIGDNQSLSDNLSTFSAHMKQVAEILDVVKGKDLVLFDELGTGTDPKEGEALALACIQYLENKHCIGLISSHFDKVKQYALSSETVENSSLLFDEDKLSPTYIYKYSIPGKSYGLDVASRYGVKKEVVDNARNLLSKDDTSISDLINKLSILSLENENMKKENELKKAELEKKEKEILNDQELIKNQRAHLLESVKEEKEKLLKELEKEISEIKKEITNKDIKLHELNQANDKVNKLRDEVEEEHFNEEIAISNYVSVPSINMNGTVTRIKGNKAYIVSDEGMGFEVELSRLHKEIRRENKKSRNIAHYVEQIDTSLKLELNIIGLHRDEALEQLIKYIDKCRVRSFKTVRIIHGFGNGILRKMTHEYLDKQKDLTYRLGDINEGGGGATVVNFK
ncbi:MAG: Smr/MutS family protein [Bacilli bacterium]|nr:Smr/MutS family protein [Bacilli bacterium]